MGGSGCVIRDRKSCRNNLGKAFWIMPDGGGQRLTSVITPPFRAAMGSWQRGALTEGLWRCRRKAPPLLATRAVPLPIAALRRGFSDHRHPGLDPGFISAALHGPRITSGVEGLESTYRCRSPAKAGVQSGRQLALRDDALGPGFRRGT